MKSNRFRIALVTLLLVALLLPTLASATTAYVTTQTSGLNLRQGPGTGYSVIRSFPRGTQVEIYSTQGAWAYVSVGGYTGYMNNSYLSTTNPNAYVPVNPVQPCYRPWIPAFNCYDANGNYVQTIYFQTWQEYLDWASTLKAPYYYYSPYYYYPYYYPYY